MSPDPDGGVRAPGGFSLLDGLPPAPADGVYLDNNATTRVAPEALAAMLPYFTERYGNPSSMHHFGSLAEAGVIEARGRVAALIGAAAPGEIVFTAGGSESDSLAIWGTLRAYPEQKHLVTLEGGTSGRARSLPRARGTARLRGDLARRGRVGRARSRRPAPRACAPTPRWCRVMAANNETGVRLPGGGAGPDREGGRRGLPRGRRAGRGQAAAGHADSRRSTCSPSPATSCTVPRGSARCTCARGPSCGP